MYVTGFATEDLVSAFGFVTLKRHYFICKPSKLNFLCHCYNDRKDMN